MDELDEDRRRNRGAAGSRPALLPWIIVLFLVAFVIGMVANPFFERTVRARLPWIAQEQDLGSLSARVERHAREIGQIETRIASLEARPAPAQVASEPDGATGAPIEPPALNDPVLPASPAGDVRSERLARLETRVEGLDRSQQTLSGRVGNLSAEVAGLAVRVENARGETTNEVAAARASADEARAVLLLTRARRAFEDGEPLGPLLPALQAVLPENYDPDLERLASGMQGGVTLEALNARFDRLAPALRSAAEDRAAEDRGFWERLLGNLREAFPIRRTGAEAEEDTLNAALEDVAAALERGNVRAALARFDTLPAAARGQARRWRQDAARHAATKAVLDRIETRVIASAGRGQPAPGADPDAPPPSPTTL